MLHQIKIALSEIHAIKELQGHAEFSLITLSAGKEKIGGCYCRRAKAKTIYL